MTITNSGTVKNGFGDSPTVVNKNNKSQIAAVGIYLSGRSTHNGGEATYTDVITAQSVTVTNSGTLNYGFARFASGVLVKDYDIEATDAISITQNSTMEAKVRSGIATGNSGQGGEVLYWDRTTGYLAVVSPRPQHDGLLFADNADTPLVVTKTGSNSVFQVFLPNIGVTIFKSKIHSTTNNISISRSGSINQQADTAVALGYPSEIGIYIESSKIVTDLATKGNITIEDAGNIYGYVKNWADFGIDYPIFGIKLDGGVRGNTITAAQNLSLIQSGLVKSRSFGLAVGIEVDSSTLTGTSSLSILQTGIVEALAWEDTSAQDNYWSPAGMRFNKPLDQANQNIYGIRMIAKGANGTVERGVNLSGGGANSAIRLQTKNTDISLGAAISNDATRWGTAPTVSENDRAKANYFVAKNNQYNVTNAGSLALDMGTGKLLAHDVNLKALGISTTLYWRGHPTFHWEYDGDRGGDAGVSRRLSI